VEERHKPNKESNPKHAQSFHSPPLNLIAFTVRRKVHNRYPPTPRREIASALLAGL
jgi:hypothetical protein